MRIHDHQSLCGGGTCTRRLILLIVRDATSLSAVSCSLSVAWPPAAPSARREIVSARHRREGGRRPRGAPVDPLGTCVPPPRLGGRRVRGGGGRHALPVVVQ